MDQASHQNALGDSLTAADTREAALYCRLKALSIPWKVFTHGPVFTVEEARDLRGAIAGVHTKNLFLKDRKNGLWLVVLREELRLDLKILSGEIGAPRFSFASAELLEARLGVPPGSVTPFALMNDMAQAVKVVLDAEMLAHSPLNFHPLRNDRTVSIAPDDFSRFLESTGHVPLIRPMPLLAD
jgi:Ala-tRNA(Pro) deacylase